MPFILSRVITSSEQPLWGEGSPYEKNSIYAIDNCCGGPSVNYDAHTIKPHSLPHIDAPSHIIKNAMTIDRFFISDKLETFYGPAVLVKITVNNWEQCPTVSGNFLYRVSVDELKSALGKISPKFLKIPPRRLLIDVADSKISSESGYDHRYALVLSVAAANWLIHDDKFLFYGVTYKSTDYMPGTPDRPIHRLLFKTGVVSECLTMFHIPEGEYFLVAFPLPLAGASESPVCPVLFESKDLAFENAQE